MRLMVFDSMDLPRQFRLDLITRTTTTIAAALLCLTISAWSQNALPEGAGKQTVSTACITCHSLSTVTNAGHSLQGWQTVVHMMINDGAHVPPDQFAVVTEYLAKNFPEKSQPDAVVVPGSIVVSIRE